jgi:maltodextrin utilization protein YvdJ
MYKPVDDAIDADNDDAMLANNIAGVNNDDGIGENNVEEEEENVIEANDRHEDVEGPNEPNQDDKEVQHQMTKDQLQLTKMMMKVQLTMMKVRLHLTTKKTLTAILTKKWHLSTTHTLDQPPTNSYPSNNAWKTNTACTPRNITFS